MSITIPGSVKFGRQKLSYAHKEEAMLVKTILNTIEKFKSFVYGNTFWEKRTSGNVLIIKLLARKNSRGECYEWVARCPMSLFMIEFGDSVTG